MARKRVKATLYDIPSYYNFWRGEYYALDGSVYRGTWYVLDTFINDAGKQELLDRWSNIAFFIAASQYAPEQKHNVIFLADKCFKKEVKSA